MSGVVAARVRTRVGVKVGVSRQLAHLELGALPELAEQQLGEPLRLHEHVPHAHGGHAARAHGVHLGLPLARVEPGRHLGRAPPPRHPLANAVALGLHHVFAPQLLRYQLRLRRLGRRYAHLPADHRIGGGIPGETHEFILIEAVEAVEAGLTVNSYRTHAEGVQSGSASLRRGGAARRRPALQLHGGSDQARVQRSCQQEHS